MSGGTLNWRCRCGQVHLDIREKRPLPMRCYCGFCRHFVEDVGGGEVLQANGGVDYIHLTPGQITIAKGWEHLGTVAYSSRGGIRWYAKCCGTPMLNTFRSVRMPYVTLVSHWLDEREAIRPARVFGFRSGASGPVPEQGAGGYVDLARVFGRVGRARLSGAWRTTPFFDAEGAPAIAPERRHRPR